MFFLFDFDSDQQSEFASRAIDGMLETLKYSVVAVNRGFT
jgi:hypothetical protein